MKRLWLVAIALWGSGGVLRETSSWAAASVIALAAGVAVTAAVLELLDMRDHRRVVASVDERFSALNARLEKAETRSTAINLEALAQLQKDVEYLKTKEALGLAGM